MDLAKLVGSFFVVCIHFWFPGTFGSLVETLARYAVPMFFIITGYFSYGVDSSRIQKRTGHILKLYCTAIVMYVLWGCISTELDGGSTVAYLIKTIPDPDEFVSWIIIQADPFTGHLWYLAALLVVYQVYRMYVCFWGTNAVNYRPLYIIGLCTFAIYFYTYILPSPFGDDVVQKVCRNAWFTGIPMFTLGLFLREYQQQILQNYSLTTKKAIALLLGGIVLVIVQWASDSMCHRPFGMLFILAGILLLSLMHPHISGGSRLGEWFLSRCGTWSTWIYILHPLVRSIYKRTLRPLVFSLLTQPVEQWLHPFIVTALSLLCAIVIDGLGKSIGKTKV